MLVGTPVEGVKVTVRVAVCWVGVGVVLVLSALSLSDGISRNPSRTALARTRAPATIAPMTTGDAHGDFGGGVGG